MIFKWVLFDDFHLMLLQDLKFFAYIFQFGPEAGLFHNAICPYPGHFFVEQVNLFFWKSAMSLYLIAFTQHFFPRETFI